MSAKAKLSRVTDWFGKWEKGNIELPISPDRVIASRFKVAEDLEFEAGKAVIYAWMKGIVPNKQVDFSVFSDEAGKPKNLVNVGLSKPIIPTVLSLVGTRLQNAISWIKDEYYWLAMIVNSDAKYYADAGETNQWARCLDYWQNGFGDPWDSDEGGTEVYADYAVSIHILINEVDLPSPLKVKGDDQ